MAVGEEPWAPKKLERKRGSVLREQNQWGSSGLRQKNETLRYDHFGPGPFPLLFLWWRWRGERGRGGRGDCLRANRGESTAMGGELVEVVGGGPR